MKDCVNTRLTANKWTPITTAETCTFYSLKADQPDVSFKIKKAEEDTAYWTVDPENNGEQAKLTVPDNDGMTGTLFYLQAVSTPLDVEVFLG